MQKENNETHFKRQPRDAERCAQWEEEVLKPPSLAVQPPSRPLSCAVIGPAEDPGGGSMHSGMGHGGRGRGLVESGLELYQRV